jgi:hypothetical protein
MKRHPMEWRFDLAFGHQYYKPRQEICGNTDARPPVVTNANLFLGRLIPHYFRKRTIGCLSNAATSVVLYDATVPTSNLRRTCRSEVGFMALKKQLTPCMLQATRQKKRKETMGKSDRQPLMLHSDFASTEGHDERRPHAHLSSPRLALPQWLFRPLTNNQLQRSKCASRSTCAGPLTPKFDCRGHQHTLFPPSDASSRNY